MFSLEVKKMVVGKQKGFTLVELLVVVLILAALAAIAIPRMVATADEAKIKACNTNVDLINSQIEAYLVKTSTAASAFDAAALTALLADTDYFPDGAPVCDFGTAYTLNTTTRHVDQHSH
jgi:prepilin-type N-terminal cleavage/methylation domain-containing protein